MRLSFAINFCRKKTLKMQSLDTRKGGCAKEKTDELETGEVPNFAEEFARESTRLSGNSLSRIPLVS